MSFHNWAQRELEKARQQSNTNPELEKMFPPERIVKIKKKELKRFIERQGVKWQRWLESMSR